MKKKNDKTNDAYESVNRRLDALIRIMLETLYENKKNLNHETAAKTLHSVGLTPTEIATILGKSSRTSVAHYLYSKPNAKKEEKNPARRKNNKDE